MRRSLLLSVLTVVVCATTPVAVASAGEITDTCGAGAKPNTIEAGTDPTVPWLDICSGSITSVPDQTGTAPTVRAELKLAGHPAMRQNAAAYRIGWSTRDCSMSLLADDLGPAEAGTEVRVRASCGATTEPCDLPGNPPVGCGTTIAGPDEFRTLPSSALRFTADSVVIDWDPDTFDGNELVLAGLQPGSVLNRLNGLSAFRGRLNAAQPLAAQYLLTDQATGEQPHTIG